jgi:NAD(P)-dependent dehydrogenase (short-subunit alcohol dehydrogenase family)
MKAPSYEESRTRRRRRRRRRHSYSAAVFLLFIVGILLSGGAFKTPGVFGYSHLAGGWGRRRPYQARSRNAISSGRPSSMIHRNPPSRTSGTSRSADGTGVTFTSLQGTTNNTPLQDFVRDFQQPAGVSRQMVLDMIQRSQLVSSSTRENFVVVVTGATGGLGSAIVKAVLEVGGLVVAVDRDAIALKKLQQQQQDEDEERIRTVVADFADLESVARAASKVCMQVAHIDILVNNAGISYSVDDDEDDDTVLKSFPFASKQNYDLLFQINYLSHFLWTERLLPKLSKGTDDGSSTTTTGRIVSIASGFSWGVNGTGLVPSSASLPLENGNGDDPTASRVFGQPLCGPRHLAQAYSHSKLAQIWHMAELNRRLNTTLAVCACPSWAATGISSNEEVRQALELFAFPTRPKDPETELAGPALKSILNAMFLPTKEMDPGVWRGESFLGNANVLETLLPKSASTGQNHFLFSDWVDQNLIPRVDISREFAVWGVLLLQRWFHQDLYFQPTSQESSNAVGQALLFDWSSQAVAEWLPTELEEVVSTPIASVKVPFNEEESEEDTGTGLLVS